MSNIAQILDRVQSGDPLAASESLPLVYQELRRIACSGGRSCLPESRRVPPGGTRPQQQV